jgi:sporulation protein YlmC with PRC-barrel domain
MSQTVFRRAALTGVAAIFAIAAAPAFAQQSPSPAPTTPSAQAPRSGSPAADRSDQSMSPGDLGGQSIQRLMGKSVVNNEGKTVGDIEDFVVESEASATGKQITYAVIGVGGFLGLGEKKVAIPVSDLQISDDKVQLSSNMTEDQLKQMPEYDRTKYRSLAGRNGESDSNRRTDSPSRTNDAPSTRGTTGSPSGTSR